MRISDWSSDVCSSDLRSTDAEGRHTLYRGEAFLGQQNIRPWRWINLVFVHHRHQHLSPDLRFRRPDTAGSIGRFGFAEQPDGLAWHVSVQDESKQTVMDARRELQGYSDAPAIRHCLERVPGV